MRERQAKRRGRLLFFAGILLLIVLMCVLGPWIAGGFGLDGMSQHVESAFTAPSFAHPLGTDHLGRDLMVRTMEGGRWALLAGCCATVVSVTAGASFGAIAGYAGGWVDEAMMRIVDILYGVPVLVFVVVTMAVLQLHHVLWLFLLIGSISWLSMARIVRGQVQAMRNQDFVLAARALGASPRRIVFLHLLPNLRETIIVYATLSLPGIMLIEAFLSFLGLGIQAPRASWGSLVATGASQIVVSPWPVLGPGIVMVVTIYTLNFLGDAVRDLLDPRM